MLKTEYGIVYDKENRARHVDMNERIEFDAASLDEIPIKIVVKWNHPISLARKGRIHFWHAEQTLLADLTDRLNNKARPYEYYRRTILPVIVRELGIEGAKFNWRQRAGCWCPCSPGFVTNASGLQGKNIFVIMNEVV